jgi:hypothetical protein
MNPAIISLRRIDIVLTLALLTACAASPALQQSRVSLETRRQENNRKEAELKQHREDLQRQREERYAQWFNRLPKPDQNRLLASKKLTDQQNQIHTVETVMGVGKVVVEGVKPDVYIDRR